MPKITRGWPPSRRRKQAELIKARQPWQNATGPKSAEGKARCARNALKHGYTTREVLALRRILTRQRAFLKKGMNTPAASSEISFVSIPLP